MRRTLSLLAAVLGGALVGVACYSQSPAPPAFRNKCADDSECNEGESCVDNLCEVRCTQATFDDDCKNVNHIFCFNGLCATGCPLDKPEVCPVSKECIDLGISAGSSSPFGGSSTQIGLCGVLCDPVDNPCPDGESCLFGVCLQTCTTADQCADGFDCTANVCVPQGAGGSGGSGGFDSTAGGSGSDGGSGDTAAADTGTAPATGTGGAT